MIGNREELCTCCSGMEDVPLLSWGMSEIWSSSMWAEHIVSTVCDISVVLMQKPI